MDVYDATSESIVTLETLIDKLPETITRELSYRRSQSDLADLYVHELYGKQKNLALLQLTEEKRRLLTAIIELIAWFICRSHQQKTIFISSVLQDFFLLVEFQKRVNSAQTIEELEQISQELIKFKVDHPELENG